MFKLRRNPRAVPALETETPLSPPVPASPQVGQAGPGPRLASVVIAVTLQRLIEDGTRDWRLEEDLVLQALRRSTAALEEADAEVLSRYLSGLSEAQLQGVAANVKGIYHELLFARAETLDGDAVSAHLHAATNHPGADVAFTIDGETIGEVQLKAVASEAQVLAHLARYPEIDVLATEEVAARMPGVGSSGFSNAELSRQVSARLVELEGDGLIDEIGDGLATSAMVSSAVIAGQALRGGDVSGRRMCSVLVDAGIGATTAGLLDVLLAPLSG